jgi:L-cystine uptake protein TcyP (sodium:dicarboxylate symporter family)
MFNAQYTMSSTLTSYCVLLAAPLTSCRKALEVLLRAFTAPSSTSSCPLPPMDIDMDMALLGLLLNPLLLLLLL